MKRILIAGGSGFVGEHLRRCFISHYYEVFVLTTQKKLSNQQHFIYWNPDGRYIGHIEGLKFDTVINLCGANLADKYWTKIRKKELMDSRIESTIFLKELINNKEIETDYIIQASAIGYYGDKGDEKLNEASEKGEGFLADLTYQWEAAIRDISIPYSILRLGVVFHPESGAFPKLVLGLKYKFLVIFGTGHQYISWIEIGDLCEMMYYLSINKIKGIFNAVSPQPIEYIDLLKSYQKRYGNISIPILIPAFVLRFILGSFSELFLFSQRVSSHKIQEIGFKFHTDTLKKYLKQSK